jgi:hypothetical protein
VGGGRDGELPVLRDDVVEAEAIDDARMEQANLLLEGVRQPEAWTSTSSHTCNSGG